MRIDDKSSEMLRSIRTQPVRPIGQDPQTQAQPKPDQGGNAAAQRGSDKVQISSAGRALAAQAGDAPATVDLSPERVAELRQRVLEGAYSSMQMVDEVARRILERGDV
jgi:negative regulator of flagellin synthesis FlgM